MIYVCAFIAWLLMSVPIGMLLGKMISDVSRDYASHSGRTVDPISKKQSNARKAWRSVRAALSSIQSPSSGGH